jgi:hypothetical protein
VSLPPALQALTWRLGAPAHPCNVRAFFGSTYFVTAAGALPTRADGRPSERLWASGPAALCEVCEPAQALPPAQGITAARPAALARALARTCLVLEAGFCARRHFWHLPREVFHTLPRPLHLPFGLRHAHMILSWNHVLRDVPITGRATAAESSPSRRPRPGRLAGQDRPGRHGSAASLPCGSAVALPRPQPKLRRLAPRLRSQVSPPAHTHMHVPHKCAMLRAAMSGGDGLPPSSLGIAGRPEEASANNTWGKPLILTVACATWGKPR